MKKIYYLLTCLALCGLTLSSCVSEKQPNEIRVLYLGGQGDWQNGEGATLQKTFASEAEFQQSIDDRMNAFGELLRTYFDSVTVMRAEDYKVEMSDGYDVTIFDGYPPKLEERVIERDASGRVTKMQDARYLPDDFSAAAITIGRVGFYVGTRLGIKNDWYCLCLDANAHSMNLEHPIFKGPFKTPITLSKQPTPEDALHYQYFQDEPVPDSVMMWRVNTKGCMTDPGFNIGMVSRPWGYLDSPDSEVISSGVCAKTIDAVAIGRHGNFLTWGFVGSPLYMSDEAKVVFANAVAYMAQFKGKTPIARKYNDRISTREYLKEKIYCVTHDYYTSRMHSDSVFYGNMMKNFLSAKAKMAKGDSLSLTGEERYVYSFGDYQIPPTPTYEEFLKRREGDELFAKFGTDEAKYIAYYTGYKPYFYGGVGMYELSVDEDALAWQIPNNDIRLIEKAISCLEKGEEVERAKRVLTRYTLCEFTQPGEWRAWFDKYKDKIFFTESGGWYFMVNEPGAPGNDYSVLERRAAAAEAEAAQATAAQPLGEPDRTNPMLVGATLKQVNATTAELRIQIKLLAGFHTYKEVAQSDPYIPLSITTEVPDGCKAGEVKYPIAKPFGSAGTTMYEDDTEIVQTITFAQKPLTVRCKVSGQCCDATVCMPPLEKEFTLELK